MTPGERADKLVEDGHRSLTIGRQCELIGVARSTYYYYPKPDGKRASEDEQLRQLILKAYEKRPFYGARRLREFLRREGFCVGTNRIGRLMRQLGLRAMGHGSINLSKARKGDRKYPYLLEGLEITRPNQVWASDITYIKLEGGFVYLVGVIDLHSRRKLSWRLSNTLDAEFCVEAFKDACERHGSPGIFNTDQGSQFTSEKFLKAVLGSGARVSMDGKGRACDNAIMERYWRSIKYEDILLKDYRSVRELEKGIAEYVRFYNSERPHQSLGYNTPDEVYYGLEIKKTA